jgi:hypothetical protein
VHYLSTDFAGSQGLLIMDAIEGNWTVKPQPASELLQLGYALVENPVVDVEPGGGFGGYGEGYAILQSVVPQVTGLPIIDGAFVLRIDGVPPLSYVVEASSDLANWTSISTNAMPVAGSFYVWEPATNRARFFRAHLQ